MNQMLPPLSLDAEAVFVAITILALLPDDKKDAYQARLDALTKAATDGKTAAEQARMLSLENDRRASDLAKAQDKLVADRAALDKAAQKFADEYKKLGDELSAREEVVAGRETKVATDAKEIEKTRVSFAAREARIADQETAATAALDEATALKADYERRIARITAAAAG